MFALRAPRLPCSLSIPPMLALLSVLVSTPACDEKTKTSELKDAAVAPTVSAAPSAPKEPESTTISMDDAAVTVNGSRVAFDAPDARGRITAELSGKPRVAGETVPLVVLRAAKATKVALVVASLKDANAKSVVLRAQKRDGQMSEIPIMLTRGAAVAPCSAIATIGKDVAISVWTVGGTTAKRFAKGMAGPDLTLGSEGFRKVIGACDSPVAYLAADESVSWGLLFDLAQTTKDVEDPKLKSLAFGLTVEAPVAGRKVTTL